MAELLPNQAAVEAFGDDSTNGTAICTALPAGGGGALPVAAGGALPVAAGGALLVAAGDGGALKVAAGGGG
ncbi:MAG: hypothetical protein ACKPKO_51400, partial [Candidatus Fonsibacter sp.]